MRKFPVEPVTYEVWYRDNMDTDVEPWRSEPADNYQQALSIMEALTADMRPRIRNTQMFVIEVSRRSVADQFNNFEEPQ